MFLGVHYSPLSVLQAPRVGAPWRGPLLRSPSGHRPGVRAVDEREGAGESSCTGGRAHHSFPHQKYLVCNIYILNSTLGPPRLRLQPHLLQRGRRAVDRRVEGGQHDAQGLQGQERRIRQLEGGQFESQPVFLQQCLCLNSKVGRSELCVAEAFNIRQEPDSRRSPPSTIVYLSPDADLPLEAPLDKDKVSTTVWQISTA